MFARLLITFVALFAMLASAAPTLVGRADLTVGPACGSTVGSALILQLDSILTSI